MDSGGGVSIAMPQPYAYLSDVSDDEWAFCVGYLALVREDAPQRKHDLRAVSDALRHDTRTGAPWRYFPGDFPLWQAVQHQGERRIGAGVFGAMATPSGPPPGGSTAATPTRRRSSSTAGRRRRRRRAAPELGTTAPSGGRAWRSTAAWAFERLPETLAGLRFLAFAALLLRQLANPGVLGR